MPTIQDVARAAGVGVGTVSRVLNGSPLVSEPTREKVQRVIDEMEYRPSSLGRALSLGRSTTSVAVIAPHFTRPSVVERLRGLAAGLAGSDYDLVLFDVESPSQRDLRFEMAARSDRAAGLVIVSLAVPPGVVDRLRRAGVPIVFLDRHVPGLPDVHVDDTHGGRLAAGHLLSLGHRRIAFVGDDGAGLGYTSSRDRLRGCREAMAEAGVVAPTGYERIGPFGREEAHRHTAALLDADPPPTAVFAASDLQALGVIETARRRGLDVPGDLSVMGFDDVEAAAYTGLTTVRQPLYESGRIAAELLLAQLAGEPSPAGVELSLELVARRTTGPPA